MILYVISVGLSVTMGLMGFINLAHGVFAMAGGYIFASALGRFGVPFLIIFSSLLIFALWFGVERTRWGAMVRAAVDNRTMAQSVGINTRRLFTLTFALGSGLAGLGGGLGADIIPVQSTYPFEHLVYFLIVVAVGGLGSLRGPFIAALLIGVADTACKYWVPQFGAFLIYAATIVILLWRPQGLFGQRA